MRNWAANSRNKYLYQYQMSPIQIVFCDLTIAFGAQTGGTDVQPGVVFKQMFRCSTAFFVSSAQDQNIGFFLHVKYRVV